MDESASSQPTLDTLRTVEFRLGLKGYNVDEVDEYLEKAAVEAEQVQSRLRAADDRVRAAEERLRQAREKISQLEAGISQPRPADAAQEGAAQPAAPQASIDAASMESLEKTLLLAQRFVEQTKRESEAEAAGIVARAEEQARQLATEAEKRLRDDVDRLEAQRARLSKEVDTVGKHLEEQRGKIRASLQEMLTWVEDSLTTGPYATSESSSPSPGTSPVPGGAPGAQERAPDDTSSKAANGAAAPDRASSPVGAQAGPKNLFEKARDAH